ncbi:hypothetical protein BDN72DRAFT_862781 [Pluteus cervinus]|uniref:Uncharacterized protein n=1 Tax=Pluteus cervinus TaxID=181527 RepID=A0ACD3AA31_9AGAR|nr:hypothetical protein BDN72DRAFT_862781 [Pluteus cervinus]
MTTTHTVTTPHNSQPESLIEDVYATIIEFVVHDDPDPPRALLSMRLVSRTWNLIILNCSRLWTRFQISHDLGQPFDARLRDLFQMLKQSRDHLLDLSFRVTDIEMVDADPLAPPIRAAQRLLADEGINSRLQFLDLELPRLEFSDVHRSLSTQNHQVLFPHLESLSIELTPQSNQPNQEIVLQMFRLQSFSAHCPNLRRLWLANPTEVRTLQDRAQFPWYQLTHLTIRDTDRDKGPLRPIMLVLPSCVQLEVCDVTFAGWTSPLAVVQQVQLLPKLLTFTVTAEQDPYLDPVLSAFTMPNLTTLATNFSPQPGPIWNGECLAQTLTACFQRSGFRLQQFTMTHVDCNTNALVGFLGLSQIRELHLVNCTVEENALEVATQQSEGLQHLDVRISSMSAKRKRDEGPFAFGEVPPRSAKRRRHD